MPKWLGGSLKNLTFLGLRSNMFIGDVPFELAQLRSLQVLDLSYNNLTGSIPKSSGNFGEMVLTATHPIPYIWRNMELTIITKRQVLMYSSGHCVMKTINLSNNNLSGLIPEELGALKALGNLNISHNHLQGKIPVALGEMHSLESLDFSFNELQGEIPQSLSALTFLNSLNLSCNNLSATIPSGNQFNSLDDPSIYVGNAYLCGTPTNKNCSRAGNVTTIMAKENDNRSDFVALH